MENLEVRRVAEAFWHLRPVLVRALQSFSLTAEARTALGTDARTYYELWQETFADKWYDMATIIRLGTAIEIGLSDAYLALVKRQGNDGTELVTPSGGSAMFQRLIEPTKLLESFQTDCGVNLAGLPGWDKIRELMLHRHLYVHRGGRVDERYIKRLHELAGQDIRPQLVDAGYPAEEVYWFAPLRGISEYIEHVSRFFRAL